MCNSEFKIKSGQLRKYVSNLYLSSVWSDVTFCIGEERLPAHKLILASRKCFEELLCGENVIDLQVAATPFKAILRYIYNDSLLLGKMEFDEIIDILHLAHKYDFKDLIAAIEGYLEQKLSIDTVCVLLEVSQQLALNVLCEACLEFMDANATTILLHEKFASLSKV